MEANAEALVRGEGGQVGTVLKGRIRIGGLQEEYYTPDNRNKNSEGMRSRLLAISKTDSPTEWARCVPAWPCTEFTCVSQQS